MRPLLLHRRPGTLRGRGPHPLDHRLNRFRAGAQAHPVHDQAGGGAKDLRHLDQMVGRQGAAGHHQVEDAVGESHLRRQLDRAAHLDDLNRSPLVPEVSFGDAGILRRDPDGAQRLPAPGPGLGKRHPPPTGSEPEIDQLVYVPALLQQHILAGDPEVRGPMLHIGQQIDRLGDEHPHAGVHGGKDQPARRPPRLRGHESRGLKRPHRILEQAAGGGRHGHEIHDIPPSAARSSTSAIAIAPSRPSPSRTTAPPSVTSTARGTPDAIAARAISSHGRSRTSTVTERARARSALASRSASARLPWTNPTAPSKPAAGSPGGEAEASTRSTRTANPVAGSGAPNPASSRSYRPPPRSGNPSAEVCPSNTMPV